MALQMIEDEMEKALRKSVLLNAQPGSYFGFGGSRLGFGFFSASSARTVCEKLARKPFWLI